MGEGGSVKPYVIIKGGFSQSLQSLTEGGRGGQKSQKLPYVIYERPLIVTLFSSFSPYFNQKLIYLVPRQKDMCK